MPSGFLEKWTLGIASMGIFEGGSRKRSLDSINSGALSNGPNHRIQGSAFAAKFSF
jgi:hypothetical protein